MERDAARARVAELEAKRSTDLEGRRRFLSRSGPMAIGAAYAQEQIAAIDLELAGMGAARMIREATTAPAHPLSAVMTEAMACDVSNVTDALDAGEIAKLAFDLAQAYPARWAGTERDRLVTLARVALAGIQACDAAAKGDGK